MACTLLDDKWSFLSLVLVCGGVGGKFCLLLERITSRDSHEHLYPLQLCCYPKQRLHHPPERSDRGFLVERTNVLIRFKDICKLNIFKRLKTSQTGQLLLPHLTITIDHLSFSVSAPSTLPIYTETWYDSTQTSLFGCGHFKCLT